MKTFTSIVANSRKNTGFCFIGRIIAWKPLYQEI